MASDTHLTLFLKFKFFFTPQCDVKSLNFQYEYLREIENALSCQSGAQIHRLVLRKKLSGVKVSCNWPFNAIPHPHFLDLPPGLGCCCWCCMKCRRMCGMLLHSGGAILHILRILTQHHHLNPLSDPIAPLLPPPPLNHPHTTPSRVLSPYFIFSNSILSKGTVSQALFLHFFHESPQPVLQANR